MRILWFLLLSISVSGCATPDRQPARGRQMVDFVQMDGDSAIRFEGVIDTGTVKRPGSAIGKWLTGTQDTWELFRRPYGVAWDDTALLVADPDAGRVVRIDARGRIMTTDPGQFAGPIGVAACSGGVLVTDSRAGTVTRLDRNLRSPSVLREGLDRPTGISCDEGRAFVAETGRHRVVVFADGGAESGVTVTSGGEIWGERGERPGSFNFPTTVVTVPHGVWIGDTLNFRVQKLDRDSGEFVRAFGALGDSPGDMPRIKGLAVDVTGNLWVSDAHLDQVALYREDGTFLLHLGEFSFPAGVAAHPDGRVAVADSMNRRIQVFRVSPADREVAR